MGQRTSTHLSDLNGQIKTSNYCGERTENLDPPINNRVFFPEDSEGETVLLTHGFIFREASNNNLLEPK